MFYYLHLILSYLRLVSVFHLVSLDCVIVWLWWPRWFEIFLSRIWLFHEQIITATKAHLEPRQILENNWRLPAVNYFRENLFLKVSKAPNVPVHCLDDNVTSWGSCLWYWPPPTWILRICLDYEIWESPMESPILNLWLNTYFLNSFYLLFPIKAIFQRHF